MASNDYQWQTEKATSEKVTGMYGPNDITIIHVQLALLTKQVGPQTPTTPIATREEIKLRNCNGVTYCNYAHFHGEY